MAMLPTVNASADLKGEAIIACELASNRRMAGFNGAETLGALEAEALLSFCLASKTSDDRQDLLAVGRRKADEARKSDPGFRVTEWPGDR